MSEERIAERVSSLQPAYTLYGPSLRWTMLAVLFFVTTFNYVDRQLISVLLEPIKIEFGISDASLGLLNGTAFALFYATLGLPVARWADRGNRKLIIAGALTVWSVMTALCGMANSFLQLVLARIGVGAGEAGAIPPAQSLIADYFPPAQRTRAFGLLMASGTAGYLISFVAGSQIAAAHGWRAAFLILGLPGLLLAICTLFFLREPRTLPGYAVTAQAQERVVATMRILARKPTFVLGLISLVLYFLISYGALVWLPSYLVRVVGVGLEDVGTSFGLAGAVSSVVGTICGGILTDRFVKRDVRWLAWMPGLLYILSWPFHELALLSSSYTLFLGFIFVGTLLQSATTPAAFALIHAVCGPTRRAISVAIVLFFGNLIGMGFGAWATGLLSDWLSEAYGPVGLRYALLIVLALFVPAGWTLLRAARSLRADWEEAAPAPLQEQDGPVACGDAIATAESK